ncbi:MAG: hypothetical protein NTX22_02005 [Ignavibacteriales bacterium]|nr:hypothetical protein [Ignavibacteriales bacterium]
MKSFIAALCLFLVFLTITISAQKGPTLSTITTKILSFVDEDGRWYPQEGWSCKGLSSGEELKTTILDKSGKAVAFAIWDFNANSDGDWAKITGCKKFSPKGHPQSDYPNLPKIAPGNYKLQISAGGKTIWETDFELTMLRYLERDHYNCTGPWKTVAYFYSGEGSDGGIINFYFEGPSDYKWFWESSAEYERSCELKAEILKNGEVLMTEGQDEGGKFKTYPGHCSKYGKRIGYHQEYQQKVLATDGNYDVIVYASDQYKNNWSPIVNLTFTVKSGKVAINESLSGESANPLHRYITSSSQYQENAVKNTVPNFRTN